jgi:hypothetical protein
LVADVELPEHEGALTDVWRDAHGEVCAFGRWHERHSWIDVPEVGRFAFAASDTEVRLAPRNGVTAERAEDAFRRIVLPLAIQARGHEVLHASAVLTPRGVVGLCGVSGTGKSTLAYALTRLGYPAYADDALAVEVSVGGVEAELLPFELMVRSGTAEFFGVPPGLAPRFEKRLPSRARLAALLLLSRSSDSPSVEIAAVAAPEAFAPVLEHGYCFTLRDRSRSRVMVESYLALVAAVPVLGVRFYPDLNHLPRLAEAVAAAVEAIAP